MNPNIGVYSVIASAVIAIASLFAPLISGLINDSAKWKREAKAIELRNIDEKMVALLEILSKFRSGSVVSATQQQPVEETYSTMLSRYYSWERVIWSRLNNADRLRVKELRAEFECGNYQTFYDKTPVLSDKILGLTNIASESID